MLLKVERNVLPGARLSLPYLEHGEHTFCILTLPCAIAIMSDEAMGRTAL